MRLLNLVFTLAAVLVIGGASTAHAAAEKEASLSESASSSFHKSYHNALDSPYLHTLNIIVDKKDEQCAYISSHRAKDRIIMSFQLIKGQADFDVYVRGHMREDIYVLKSGEHDGSDRIFFMSKDEGEYSICFDARNYADSVRVVRITVASQSKRKTARTMDPLTQLLDKCEAGLRTLTQDQAYIRVREIRHRTTLESNNRRVLIMWGIEFFVLLSLSVGQVMYLRRLFNKKKDGRVA